MLSPNDLAPKGKAPSIWSIDSGYGSNTLEDDEPLQLHSQPSVSTGYTNIQYAQQPIGLGISGFWNVQVKDQLRLRRPESPVRPVTTKLNVFTNKTAPNNDLLLPGLNGNTATCITCQLWDLTNPGAGLKCDDCKSTTLHPKSDAKLAVPRIDNPHNTQSQRFAKRHNKTRCSACDLALAIDPIASPTCPSCTPNPDLHSPISLADSSPVKRSCARRPSKLPPYALHHLRAWLKANRDNPYPSPDTKRTLAQECGITEKQVTTWFTNTRARKLSLPSDPPHPSSEDEGPYESDFSSIANTPIYTSECSFAYGTPSNCQPTPSVACPATYDVFQPRLQTSRRGKKKNYRRMATVSPVDDSPVPRTPATPSPNLDGAEQETWQCTYCYQQLVPKSWRRHEETQHRPKFQWTCLATGPRLPISSCTGTFSICAFCQTKNPSDDHFLHAHRILECSKKDEADRTFGRPDHLRQHVKNFHKASLLDLVREKWRRDGPGKNVNETWKCGFCALELKTWDIRETHIANHFKDGLTMTEWTDYPQPTAATVESSKIRQSREEHPNMFAKLKRTLTGRSNRHPGHAGQPQAQFANTFQQLPASASCSSLAPPGLPEFPDTMFGVCIPDAFGTDIDFSVPSVANFDTNYTSACNMYPAFPNDEVTQLDFDVLPNPELYENFVDYEGGWNQQQQ